MAKDKTPTKRADKAFTPPSWPAGKIETRKVGDLLRNPRNVRTHPPAQITAIAASFDEFGVTVPIVVDEKNLILGGHGRLEAAIVKGFEEVPVVVARGWTDEKKRRYMLAENRLFEMGGYDQAALKRELRELREFLTEDVHFTALGFDDADALDRLIAEDLPPEQFQEFGEDIAVEHQCPKCAYRWSGSSAPPAAPEPKNGALVGNKANRKHRDQPRKS